jgi:hypothetical protein
MATNFLNATGVDQWVNELKTIMATEPADDTALLAAMDTYFDGISFRKKIYQQVLGSFKREVGLGGGKIGGTITITDGGTGYSVGDIMSVSGATSGVGGTVKVTSVTGGVIDGIEVLTAGNNYVGALTINVGDAGNADAVLVMDDAATYEDESVVDATIATVNALA